MKNFYFNRAYLCLFSREIKGKRIKIPKGSFLMFLLLFPVLNLYSQQVNVEGIVQSSKDNLALIGATISLEGSSVSTVSDEAGEFSFNSPNESGTIVVKYVGYKPFRLEFDKDSQFPLNISLYPIENTLDDVQVIGYGETTKRFNTGSVVTVSSKEIEQQPVANLLSALSGRVTGVYVQSENGLPGGNINIQIRGSGSILAGTNPLYIIDGVPFDGAGEGIRSNLSTTSILGAISPLSILNPNDIENITILKDADATAIYGSRGSNGVVLIDTKKGKADGTKVTFNINQGVSKASSKPDLLKLDEYLELRKEAFANENRTPSSDPTSPDYAPDLTVWSQSEGVDWFDYIYGNAAGLTNAQLSISGGSRNTSFNLSGNYRSEGTILRGANKYNKGGIQSHINHQSPNGKFKVHFSSIYNLDNTNLSNPSNSSLTMLLSPPNFPMRNDDGSFLWYLGQNIDAELLARAYLTSQNFVGNFAVSYMLPLGLELKMSGGYNKRVIDQDYVFPSRSLREGRINSSRFGENSSSSYIIEPLAEYNKQFLNSKLQVLLGGTYQTRTADKLFIVASNFSNESLMRNLGSAGVIDTRTNDFVEYKYVSAFGRLTYNIQDKYVFNGTLRRDGSSRFGPDNRYGNFFSLGGAWLFSEENWMDNLEGLISFGKLRASYGLTGNDQITDYQYLSTYQTRSSNLYQGLSVLMPGRIFNSKFHWEVTKKFEVAMELGLFGDRLFLTTNYYRNRSGTQLVNYPLPRTTGFSSYQANLPAVVENTGWEFDVQAEVIQSSNFQWKTTANVTFPKNRLVSFENIENSSYANSHKVGYDITREFGWGFINVDPQSGIAQFADENGKVSDNPFQFFTLGKRTPSFYGGLGNDFSYKKLGLTFFMQFSKHTSFGNLSFRQFGFHPMNAYRIIDSRWKEVGDDADLPKASIVNSYGASYVQNSSSNFFDVVYLRMKNISLSYMLPEFFSKRIGASSIQLSATAQNMFTLWDKDIPIIDPEAGGDGIGFVATPPVKSFVFGVRVSF